MLEAENALLFPFEAIISLLILLLSASILGNVLCVLRVPLLMLI